ELGFGLRGRGAREYPAARRKTRAAATRAGRRGPGSRAEELRGGAWGRAPLARTAPAAPPSARARGPAAEQARRVTRDGAEEGAAPEPGGHQRAEQHHCVDARATLTLPVDVLEVQPQRELVERERSPRAVEHGRQPADSQSVAVRAGVH